MSLLDTLARTCRRVLCLLRTLVHAAPADCRMLASMERSILQDCMILQHAHSRPTSEFSSRTVQSRPMDPARVPNTTVCQAWKEDLRSSQRQLLLNHIAVGRCCTTTCTNRLTAKPLKRRPTASSPQPRRAYDGFHSLEDHPEEITK